VLGVARLGIAMAENSKQTQNNFLDELPDRLDRLDISGPAAECFMQCGGTLPIDRRHIRR
jgi:hypothetical protein